MDFSQFIQSEYNHTFRNNNHVFRHIFKDFWELFLEKEPNLNIRGVVKTEVNKFIPCGSKDNGFSYYECQNCGNYLYVPFTCKSRFYPFCGVNSCLKISQVMPTRCLDVPHRHITFTISDSLWPYFQKNCKLLIFSLNQLRIPFFLGLKVNPNWNNLLLVLLPLYIPSAEILNGTHIFIC